LGDKKMNKELAEVIKLYATRSHRDLSDYLLLIKGYFNKLFGRWANE